MNDKQNENEAACGGSALTAELGAADKCTVRDGKYVDPCKNLSAATEYGNPRGKQKGLWCWEYYAPDSMGPTRRFFGAKSGDHVGKGLAFNYCPFCGVQIDAPFTVPNA